MVKKKEFNERYFDQKEEQAVIDYINSDSKEEKDRIYNEILIIPFRKMIQSILRTYPIHIGNYKIEEVEANALSHLIEHMVIFNPNNINKSGKKTKAFSYCQTIVRNYYRDHGKRSYQEKKSVVSFDDYVDDIDQKKEYQYNNIEQDGFDYYDMIIKNIISKIEYQIDSDTNLKKNEIIVGDAIINILKNWNMLFLENTKDGCYNKKITNKFEKNKILLYLKEQTGLTTKEIRMATKPFKDIYFLEKLKSLDD